ncbi:predicted protein [Arabidopsis lyrata subsp. lyrata]|uniref:Predicted protein n=1 Tax=Arabidopsis lyrata subsp. lyrata TaxID=81972 RepID=D7LHV3_ARALL|nr:predicted protein [Arabidopsis lyrata subsp. lyrata]
MLNILCRMMVVDKFEDENFTAKHTGPGLLSTGVKMARKDWEKLHLHIASHNNFHTASSAAGCACLGSVISLSVFFVTWFT